MDEATYHVLFVLFKVYNYVFEHFYFSGPVI